VSEIRQAIQVYDVAAGSSLVLPQHTVHVKIQGSASGQPELSSAAAGQPGFPLDVDDWFELSGHSLSGVELFMIGSGTANIFVMTGA